MSEFKRVVEGVTTGLGVSTSVHDVLHGNYDHLLWRGEIPGADGRFWIPALYDSHEVAQGVRKVQREHTCTRDEALERMQSVGAGLGKGTTLSILAGVEIDHLPREAQEARYQALSRATGLRWYLWVFSGGKSVHAYLGLSTPIPSSDPIREEIQRLLVVILEGDTHITDAGRKMRLPGWLGTTTDRRQQPITHFDPTATCEAEVIRDRLLEYARGLGIEDVGKTYETLQLAERLEQQAAKEEGVTRGAMLDFAGRLRAERGNPGDSLLRWSRNLLGSTETHEGAQQEAIEIDSADPAWQGLTPGRHDHCPWCGSTSPRVLSVESRGGRLVARCWKEGITRVSGAARTKLPSFADSKRLQSANEGIKSDPSPKAVDRAALKAFWDRKRQEHEDRFGKQPPRPRLVWDEASHREIWTEWAKRVQPQTGLSAKDAWGLLADWAERDLTVAEIEQMQADIREEARTHREVARDLCTCHRGPILAREGYASKGGLHMNRIACKAWSCPECGKARKAALVAAIEFAFRPIALCGWDIRQIEVSQNEAQKIANSLKRHKTLSDTWLSVRTGDDSAWFAVAGPQGAKWPKRLRGAKSYNEGDVAGLVARAVQAKVESARKAKEARERGEKVPGKGWSVFHSVDAQGSLRGVASAIYRTLEGPTADRQTPSTGKGKAVVTYARPKEIVEAMADVLQQPAVEATTTKDRGSASWDVPPGVVAQALQEAAKAGKIVARGQKQQIDAREVAAGGTILDWIVPE